MSKQMTKPDYTMQTPETRFVRQMHDILTHAERLHDWIRPACWDVILYKIESLWEESEQ